MKKTFAEALGDLLSEYSADTDADEIISEMECQLMALKEYTGDE